MLPNGNGKCYAFESLGYIKKSKYYSWIIISILLIIIIVALLTIISIVMAHGSRKKSKQGEIHIIVPSNTNVVLGYKV